MSLLIEKTCNDYIEVLASKAAVPGGGSAAALAGAIGMALGIMVGNLTIGKKKYADSESEIIGVTVQADSIQKRLLQLVDLDAVNFEPLARAYSIPKDDPNRPQIMQDALETACTVPIEIMRICAKAIELQSIYADKGSAIAVSDAGVGAVLCKAALQGAALNVFINTQAMSDKKCANSLTEEADQLLSKFCPMADEVFNCVAKRLR